MDRAEPMSSSDLILAAGRHLDPAEGVMRLGHIVTSADLSALHVVLNAIAPVRSEDVPGWEGSVGPFPRQYNDPHVYARDVHSGAGNCVCARTLPDRLHVLAAPGIPIPEEIRP